MTAMYTSAGASQGGGDASLAVESPQLDPSTSRSFIPLSTLALTQPHVLHPQACNTTMDLVALLAPAQPATVGPADIKGKGRVRVPDMSAWRGTKVSLHRMLGSQVWEVEVKGWVAAMAWSSNGLYLSLLVIMNSARRAVLEHRSVHTGEEMKLVPLDLPEEVWSQGIDGKGVEMSWIANTLSWEDPSDGSARQIIASLPTVTPVQPPKPAVNNPFAKAPSASTSKLPHAKLSTFPFLLSSSPPLAPHVLAISLPHREIRLLTGSFPCPAMISASHLRLGQSADMLASFFDTTLRGLEAIEAAWRDAYKQNMLWREELEECGKLHGMPVRDVHADLFRLLMTGRCREAVSEWLGNKLTGRMLAKWEQTLTTTFQTIQSVIVESISPALERIMIVLQEVQGWSHSQSRSAGLDLRSETVDQCIDLAAGLIKLIERMRQDAEHEALASAAWVAWLKYETAQAGASGGEEPPIAIHDLKLTWSFLVNSFVRSIFSTYFPDNTPSRPPTDELPDAYIQSLRSRPTQQSLDEVLADTMSYLSGRPARGVLQSPVVDGEEGMSLDRSSMDLSSIGDDTRQLDASGVGKADMTGLDDDVLDSDDESTGTAGKVARMDEEEKEVPRVLELEPWVWMNSLITVSEGLINVAVGAEGEKAEPKRSKLRDMRSVWRSGEEEWGATIGEGGTPVILLQDAPSELAICLSIKLGSSILALQFFDDMELALVLESPNGRYLITVDYKSYLDRMTPIRGDTGADEWNIDVSVPLEIRRARYLAPVPTEGSGIEGVVGLALNGRKGRRVGCVLGVKEGDDLEVWDMDGDEDEDEQEDEEVQEEDREVEEEGKEDESM